MQRLRVIDQHGRHTVRRLHGPHVWLHTHFHPGSLRQLERILMWPHSRPTGQHMVVTRLGLVQCQDSAFASLHRQLLNVWKRNRSSFCCSNAGYKLHFCTGGGASFERWLQHPRLVSDVLQHLPHYWDGVDHGFICGGQPCFCKKIRPACQIQSCSSIGGKIIQAQQMRCCVISLPRLSRIQL